MIWVSDQLCTGNNVCDQDKLLATQQNILNNIDSSYENNMQK